MTKRHKLSASAIIGVILMVAITVAIAGTVYYYVLMLHTKDIENKMTNGTITGKFRCCPSEYQIKYFVVVNNEYDVRVNESIYYDVKIGDIIYTYRNWGYLNEVDIWMRWIYGRNR